MTRQVCEHGKRKSQCRDCGGSSFCEHGKWKNICRECGGVSICQHGKRKSQCRDCDGSSFCEHGKWKEQCRDCNGSLFCEHNRNKNFCKECNGTGICIHNKRKSQCFQCKGSEICPHMRRKNFCVDCGGSQTCKGHSSTLCYTLANPRYNNYCIRCYQYFFPNEPVCSNYRTKEKVWVDFIIANFSGYDWSFNKTIEYGCSKYRPDAILDLGSHIILLEHDENQHNTLGYSCENKRIMAIMNDIGLRPIIVVRFNPDGYVNNGKKYTSCWGVSAKGVARIKPSKITEFKQRLNIFKDIVKYNIENMPEKEVTEIKLFYDS